MQNNQMSFAEYFWMLVAAMSLTAFCTFAVCRLLLALLCWLVIGKLS